jgi:multidrug efflux pump subunit AcrB
VFGPPVGFPVQFRVIGPDPMKVREIAEQVRQVMAANPKIIDPHLDWNEQVKSIRLEVDQDRARALGLTPQDVAQMLQTLLSGLQSLNTERASSTSTSLRVPCQMNASSLAVCLR